MNDLLLWVVIVFAIGFDFTNGFHDTANAVATSVSTRALAPRTAVLIAAVMNLAGAFAWTAVADTVGNGLLNGEVSLHVLLAALLGAIVWNLVTWRLGLPSSSSHALIGGLVGAAVAGGGTAAVDWGGIWHKVIVPAAESPLIGFVLAVPCALDPVGIPPRAAGSADRSFRHLQIASGTLMAFLHGTNDAQKTMGVIALALYSTHHISSFYIPWYVKLGAGLALGIGTYVGGWRIMRTMGTRITKLEPHQGFAAQTTASLVLWFTARNGFPISTTQVIAGSVMGAGATTKLSAVRWGVAANIVVAWVLTLPRPRWWRPGCTRCWRPSPESSHRPPTTAGPLPRFGDVHAGGVSLALGVVVTGSSRVLSHADDSHPGDRRPVRDIVAELAEVEGDALPAAACRALADVLPLDEARFVTIDGEIGSWARGRDRRRSIRRHSVQTAVSGATERPLQWRDGTRRCSQCPSAAAAAGWRCCWDPPPPATSSAPASCTRVSWSRPQRPKRTPPAARRAPRPRRWTTPAPRPKSAGRWWTPQGGARFDACRVYLPAAGDNRVAAGGAVRDRPGALAEAAIDAACAPGVGGGRTGDAGRPSPPDPQHPHRAARLQDHRVIIRRRVVTGGARCWWTRRPRRW